jgi:penicillin-insensitive murein endopeptidase
MFASRGIEALLIDYAIARGEDPDLIWHAETVLLQPADSTPHADHIHMRIACTPSEAVAGCDGGGPYWPWLPGLPVLAPLDADSLAEIARDDPFDLEMVAESGPAERDGA